jgi:hypothetical protein
LSPLCRFCGPVELVVVFWLFFFKMLLSVFEHAFL